MNIFNFNKDIYNQDATIYFIERLRDEVKFNGIDELTKQLALDKMNSEKVLNK